MRRRIISSPITFTFVSCLANVRLELELKLELELELELLLELPKSGGFGRIPT